MSSQLAVADQVELAEEEAVAVPYNKDGLQHQQQLQLEQAMVILQLEH
jgi:hypothetical protein